MKGQIQFWNPRQKWGRIRADNGKRFFFKAAWIAEGCTRRNFKRGEKVTFDGDTTAHPQTNKPRKVAYRVKPAT